MIHLILPPELAQQLADLATIAAPAECCGLIEGHWEGDTAHVARLHPARNLAEAGKFEIAPDDHFAARKDARAGGKSVIGCYHSHPNAAPEPSAADIAGIGEDHFIWLIAGSQAGGWDMEAFVSSGGALAPVYLVMSSE